MCNENLVLVCFDSSKLVKYIYIYKYRLIVDEISFVG